MAPKTKSRGKRAPRSRGQLEQTVFARLSHADIARLERIASRLGWSRSDAIRAALRAFFIRHD